MKNVSAINVSVERTENLVCHKVPGAETSVCFYLPKTYISEERDYVMDINMPFDYRYNPDHAFSDDEEQNIKKLVHFGYKFYGNKSEERYIATQILLWEMLYSDYEFYYEFDPDLNDIESVINEVRDLYNDKLVPSFGDIIIKERNEITLIDENRAICNSEIYSSDTEFTVVDNKFIYYGSEPGNYHIVYKKDYPFYTKLRYYNDIDSIYIPWQENYTDKFTINITVLKNRITINSSTEKQYGMYDANDNLLEYFTVLEGEHTYILNPDTFYIGEILDDNILDINTKIIITGDDCISLVENNNDDLYDNVSSENNLINSNNSQLIEEAEPAFIVDEIDNPNTSSYQFNLTKSIVLAFLSLTSTLIIGYIGHKNAKNR